MNKTLQKLTQNILQEKIKKQHLMKIKYKSGKII